MYAHGHCALRRPDLRVRAYCPQAPGRFRSLAFPRITAPDLPQRTQRHCKFDREDGMAARTRARPNALDVLVMRSSSPIPQTTDCDVRKNSDRVSRTSTAGVSLQDHVVVVLLFARLSAGGRSLTRGSHVDSCQRNSAPLVATLSCSSGDHRDHCFDRSHDQLPAWRDNRSSDAAWSP